MRLAYPVLEAGCEEKVARIMDYLAGISNLELTGRTGTFAYVHLHDLMQRGREIALGCSG